VNRISVMALHDSLSRFREIERRIAREHEQSVKNAESSKLRLDEIRSDIINLESDLGKEAVDELNAREAISNTAQGNTTMGANTTLGISSGG